ncbi:hypothetical protein LT350_25510 [Mycolicibacterium smegmatis]|uniref:hypothetical protein n=1 Tax=Mycolicibacterium smegmatis TaxID=1772 RepID=UPI001E4DDF5F|nr:hypothetical protein [Mycolicibacterium smegmatis]UGU29881.1 hypothetical protein LT350_25510 [Mycolicibacterium smegmatis]ULN70818.1 hypothetical protein KZ782_02320 [Mycolicibacterium smegmatis]
MADHLMVKPGEAFNTAHTVANYAAELHDELQRLTQEWDNLEELSIPVDRGVSGDLRSGVLTAV